MFWITQRDMTSHALSIVIATKDPKRTGHVFQHPTSLVVDGREGGDPRQRGALGDGLKALRVFLLLFGISGRVCRG